jgi:hypothetical protein
VAGIHCAIVYIGQMPGSRNTKGRNFDF